MLVSWQLQLKSLKDLISKGEKVAAETEARATEEEKNLRNAEIAAQASDTANEVLPSIVISSSFFFILPTMLISLITCIIFLYV